MMSMKLKVKGQSGALSIKPGILYLRMMNKIKYSNLKFGTDSMRK